MADRSIVGATSEPLASGHAAEHVVRNVYDGCAQQMFGFGRRMGLADDEASDAVQETMLRLWRTLRDGEEIDDPEAWSYRVLYRQAMDAHRARRRISALAARLGLAATDRRLRDSTDPADRSDVDVVWEAVDRLTDRQRAVVYLRYRADLPFERVAAVLGVSASAARSYASTGLAALRRQLGNEVE